MKLMRGARRADWLHLLNFARLRQLVRIYCPGTKSLLPGDGVPWPIIWILARYSSKHIFAGKSKPVLQVYNEAAGRFCDKLRWRWLFGDSGEYRRLPFNIRRPTAKFTSKAHPAPEAWIGGLHNTVMQQIRNSRALAPSSSSNMLPLDRLGL